MTGYIVTITPDGNGGGPETTLRVDTTTGQVREVTVRAGEGNGIELDQLPAIDLAGLAAALSPRTVPAIEPPVVVAEPAEAAAPAEAPAPADTPADSGARTRGAKSTTRTAKSATRATKSAARASKAGARTAKSAGRTAKSATAEKPGPRKRATRSAEPTQARRSAEPTNGRRAYRRIPDTDAVVAAYRQAGSVGPVAEQFGVPRHTVTGWLRRLRRLGLIESSA
jgi:hypothetical protein